VENGAIVEPWDWKVYVMARPMSRTKRMEAAMQEAQKMFEAMEAWYDAHPDASFGEIELEARRVRREFMGRLLEIVVNGRDAGVQVEELPECADCGRKMSFEGYNEWTIRGLEGETTLERAYYLCPECKGQGFFPPGSQTQTAE
jgi:DNA-directed RNA polymerase subunit RPC12/RpoP